MAKAIAGGIVGNSLKTLDNIYAYDPYAGQAIDGVELLQDVKDAIGKSGIIFLCVKPQVFFEVIDEIKDFLTVDHIIVSIAAGISHQKIVDAVLDICPVVRTMPNTPLMLGFGTTAIAKPNNIKDDDYKVVSEIFGCMGEVFEIPSDKFDEIIPVNSSSPAFIYQFAKTTALHAEKHGLDFSMSLKMMAGTLIGSAKMILDSGIEIDTLIDMVCSKKGATIAGLEAMSENGFETAIQKGFDAAVERSKQLSK